jgi:hypothetical protein
VEEWLGPNDEAMVFAFVLDLLFWDLIVPENIYENGM